MKKRNLLVGLVVVVGLVVAFTLGMNVSNNSNVVEASETNEMVKLAERTLSDECIMNKYIRDNRTDAAYGILLEDMHGVTSVDEDDEYIRFFMYDEDGDSLGSMRINREYYNDKYTAM